MRKTIQEKNLPNKRESVESIEKQSDRRSDVDSVSCSGFAVCWENLSDFIPFL